MGALTDALAAAARAAGAEIATGHEVGRIDDGRRVAPRSPTGPRTARAPSPPGTSWSNASPQELAALLGDEPPAPAEGAQLKVNMLLQRLPAAARRAPSTRARRSPGPSTSPRATAQLAAAYAQAAAGAAARRPAVRDLLPLADRPVDPRPGPGRHRATRRSPCSACTPPPGCSTRDNDAVREALLKATLAQLDAHLAEPLADCLATDADGRPCIEAKTPLDLERDLRPARRQHLPPRPGLARTPRRAPAAGAWRPATPTCCCAGRARCAAAG